MLANLLTTLIIACGVGVSSFEDHNPNTQSEINNSVSYIGGNYLLSNTYDFTLDFDQTVIYNSFSPSRIMPHQFIFEFLIGEEGYIYTDGGDTYSSSSNIINGASHVDNYYGLKFEFTTNISWLPQDQYPLLYFFDFKPYVRVYDNSLGLYYWSVINEYTTCNNLVLSNYQLLDDNGDPTEFYGFDLNRDLSVFVDDIRYRVIEDNESIEKNVVVSPSNSSNYFFSHAINSRGYYSFTSAFNPWKSLYSQSGDFQKFGKPYYYNEWVSWNTLKVYDGNFFYHDGTSYDSYKDYQVNLFEGLFIYGGVRYTNIVCHFASHFIIDTTTSPYHYYCLVQFTYMEFVNYDTSSHLVVLSTNGFIKNPNEGGLNGGYDLYYATYNPSITPLENYTDYLQDNYNQIDLNSIPSYSQLQWNIVPTINIFYTNGRPSNTIGFRGGLSFNNLLGYNGASSEDSSDTYNNLNNVFFLVASAFSGLIPLLQVQILPNLTFGTLIFIPLVFLIVFAIIKLFKR